MKIRLLAKVSTLVILTLGFFTSSQAQLVIDTLMTPDQMTANLVGNGVTISNTVVTGASRSYGYYYSTNTAIGTNDGILLTTGKVISALGPNDETGFPLLDSANNCLTCPNYNNETPGDPLLNAAFGVTSWDACKYEFDIVPQGDSLSFEFHFASEEYLEWVGSSFNDVFGFFISGPGLAQVNIATIPGTTTPIAVNNVNLGSNPSFFYDNTNPAGNDIQYDGFTVNTVASIGGLFPCQTYHIELIIADVSDRLYDSGVFISKIESNPVTIQTSTVEGLPYMIEGCNEGLVNFVNPFPTLGDLDVEFTMGGTADFGTDYTTVPDISNFYNAGTDSYFMTIPAGDTTVGFAVLPLVDNIEGEEFINIQLYFQLCDSTSTVNTSIDFSILDNLPVSLADPGGTVCPGQCIQLAGTAESQGTASFYWSPTTFMTDTLSLTPTVCPTETTTYTLTNVAGSCSNSEQVTVVVSALEANLDVTNVTCGSPNIGAIDITMNSGIAPYNYTWSGSNGYSSTDEDISGLTEGQYCVVVEDATGCTTQFCATVEVDNLINISFDKSSYQCGYEISCNGSNDGFINIDLSGGSPAYNIIWTLNGAFYSNAEDLANLVAGTYVVTVSDQAGCVVSQEISMDEPEPLSVSLDGVVEVLCTGESSGVVSLAASGGCAPYFYSWSHDPNLTSSQANVPTGTYTATVTDNNGCASVDSVTVFVAEPAMPVTVSIDNVLVHPGGYNVSCPDANDGEVDISVSGGTPGVNPDPAYTFEWLHLSSGTIITDEDPVGMACGDWQLTVTDGNGCSSTQIVNLTCVPAITIEYTTVSNGCGNPNGGAGEIHITNYAGGNGGPYSIVSWAGPSCPCVGEDLVGLDSGDYTVLVQDGLGCTQSVVINVGMNDQFIVNEFISNETCFGYCNGTINLDIVPPAYDSLVWNGPDGYSSNQEDISNLCAGNYSVIVYSGGCEETYIYNIGTAPEIGIDLLPTNPTCFGNSNGSITAVLSGGVGVLTPTWTADSTCFFPDSGSNDMTINGLLACTYYISVEDGNSCVATDSIVLDAPQVMELEVSVSQYTGGYNVSCPGANDGSASATVVGGTPDCVNNAPDCYQFDWVLCGTTELYANGSFLNDLYGGCYSLLVTDSLGCTATTIVTLTEPDPITISYTTSPLACNDSIVDWVVLDPQGGSGDYDVPVWLTPIGNNAADADTLFNLPFGQYCAIWSDNNECPADTACFTLSAPEDVVVNLDSIQNVTCFGLDDGYIAVSGQGGISPYSYSWTNNPSTSGLITDLTPGSYTVEVVDSVGCSNTATYAISEPALLEVNLLVPTNIPDPIYTIPCKGDEVVIIADVTGGTQDYSFLWQDCDNNLIDSLGGSTSQGAGCYQVFVTDNNGCMAQDSILVTEPDSALVASVMPSVYPGGYNLSCFNSSDGSICGDASGGVPDYNYFWTSGNDTISFTPCIDSLGEGVYELLLVDANGCDTLFNLNLVAPPEILLNSAVSNVTCYGACDGTISINPEGGTGVLSVDWDVVVSDSLNLTGLCVNDFTVTVTDALNCSLENSFVITQPDSLWLSASIDQNSCFGGNDGSIFVTATGGNGGNTALWTPNGETSMGIDNLVEDQYCITVTDSVGCQADACYEINDPPIIDVPVITTDATCGLANGSASVDPSGGVPPYSIDWNGIDTSAIAAGTYEVTVTDAVGCSVTISYTIDGPDPVEIQSIVTDVNCAGNNNGAVDVTLLSSVTVDDYVWLNSDGDVVANTIDVDGLSGGNYILEIHWGGDCIVPFDFTIDEPDPIMINGYSPEDEYGFNISINGEATGEIFTDVTGGVPPYLYNWDGPQEILDGVTHPTDLMAGDYNLQVTDVNGCVKDTIFMVTEAPDLGLPTGVTPNGDGDNDFYVILGLGKYTNNTFKVFNRWGNLVYDKTNYNNEWNGQNSDGENLPNGTYYVVFESGDVEAHTYVDLRR